MISKLFIAAVSLLIAFYFVAEMYCYIKCRRERKERICNILFAYRIAEGGLIVAMFYFLVKMLSVIETVEDAEAKKILVLAMAILSLVLIIFFCLIQQLEIWAFLKYLDKKIIK